jgi:hypothetical protein
MFQTDQPTAVSSLPAPATAGSQGFFTGGNPGAGQPATILDPDFMNMVMMELINIVTASGQTPSKTNNTQVLTALASMLSPVIGQMRNAKMSIPAVSASATFSADEVVVGSSLGGRKFLLANFNQSVNLAVPGIGGVVGTGPVANGFAAIYAAWGPGVGSGIFATSGASLMPQVYGGALPSGYTASALISVWQLNGAGQFIPGLQRDRRIARGDVGVLTTNTTAPSLTALSIVAAVPMNAIACSGRFQFGSTTASNLIVQLGSDAAGSGAQGQAYSTIGSNFASSWGNLLIGTPQQIFYLATSTGGTPNFSIDISGYEI